MLAAVALLVGCTGPLPGQGGRVDGGSGADQVAGYREDGTCIDAPDLDDLAEQVLTLINIERAKMGVAPLTKSDTLAQVAENYACAMAAQDFFAHVDPVTGEGPGDRARAGGYEFFAVGENLAAGQTTAAQVVEDWMNSEMHRVNLLSPEWKETGIGVRRGGEYGVYWAQEFGQPAAYPLGHPTIDPLLQAVTTSSELVAP